MSSGCGKLDSRDVDVILEKPTLKGKKCSDGLKLLLYSGIEDAQKEKHVYEKCEEKEPSSVRSPGADGSPCKSSDGQDYHEDDDFAIALQLMFYEPTPVRLVSAMKGSREKQGNSAGKLKVKWAEDVYDPPPSISSHTRCKMQPQAQTRSKSKDGCKRNGKKGQKGKDKKHSSRNKQSREELRVGNPESHCAGSFLRSNPTKGMKAKIESPSLVPMNKGIQVRQIKVSEITMKKITDESPLSTLTAIQSDDDLVNDLGTPEF